MENRLLSSYPITGMTSETPWDLVVRLQPTGKPHPWDPNAHPSDCRVHVTWTNGSRWAAGLRLCTSALSQWNLPSSVLGGFRVNTCEETLVSSHEVCGPSIPLLVPEALVPERHRRGPSAGARERRGESGPFLSPAEAHARGGAQGRAGCPGYRGDHRRVLPGPAPHIPFCNFVFG